MKVLVLGCGKMISAMLLGLKGEVDFSTWGIFSPSGVSAKDLALKLGAVHVEKFSSFPQPDFVLVGCKPQQLAELKQLIQDQFSETLFVSVLAALSETDQLHTLGAKNLIRLMPNLPVKVRAGVMLMASVSASDRLPEFEKLFSTLGLVKLVSEAELEDLTLLTGSGPAFFYEFALELSRQSSALSSDERDRLARKVLEGTGRLLASNTDSLSTHVNNVTSKGGVTIAVLNEWRNVKWGEVLKVGWTAGTSRAREIRASLRRQN